MVQYFMCKGVVGAEMRGKVIITGCVPLALPGDRIRLLLAGLV